MGIALDKNNNIYVAGMGSNNVVVLSADGKNVLVLQSVHLMVSSRNDMCAEFAPGILTRSINLPLGSKYVVLSADGKNCKQILTKSDGLNKPWSLRINIDRNELLVCNLNGPAFLFILVLLII
jgi:DNA-binding beta-propeller fold protein YncE